MTLSQQKIYALLPTITSYVLLAVMAVLLADITFKLIAKQAHAPTVSPNTSQPVTNNTTPNDTRLLLIAQKVSQRNLFGKAGTATAPETATTVVDAPETKLDLKLRGILATGKQDSLAIIAQGSQEEKMYKIGDALPGNATLHAVYADKVLIESGRGLETLRIELEKNIVAYATVDNPGLPNTTSQEQKTDFSKLRSSLIRNPLSFTKKITIQPETGENGQLIGYKLNPAQDQEVFNELGLQAGDIATKLNGLDLSNTNNARKAMNILRRSKKLTMTILRSGQEITLEQQL